MTCKTTRLLFTLLLLWSSSSLAGPAIILCQHHCHDRPILNISDPVWHTIAALFSPRPDNASAERRAITHALVLFDGALAQAYEQDDDDWLEQNFSEKDQERNAASFIAQLMDDGLVQQHVLRRTEHREGYSSAYAVALQERSSGDIYVLDSSVTDFGKPPQVQPLAQWRQDPKIRAWHNLLNRFTSESSHEQQ